MAVERLDISTSRFDRCTPRELAWRLWGERRRRNTARKDLAWAVSSLMSVQVLKQDQSKVQPRRMFLALVGDGADEDEVGR